MATPRSGTPTVGNEQFDPELQRRVIELWGQKMPVADIARRLHIRTWAVDRYVNRWLRHIGKPDAEQRRKQDADALDELDRLAWRIIEKPGYKVSPSGQVIIDPKTGGPLLDTGRQLEAIGALLRVLTRRAKLFGLDAPKRATVPVSLEAAIAAVERLEREADRVDGWADEVS